MKSQLLIDIVEAIQDYGSTGTQELFEEIVSIFIRNGMTVDDLQECYGINDNLDDVIDDYELTTDDSEYEEDEWPDGGREDF